MCVACLEYQKNKMTSAELKAAMREMTVDDQKHREEVERLIRDLSGNPDELKRKIGELNARRG